MWSSWPCVRIRARTCSWFSLRKVRAGMTRSTPNSSLLSMTADAVASNFLGSIAQDIVERWDNTNTDNLRQGLESCLLLTDSKCNVPDPLQKELGASQLTLGQYLLKKHR